MDMRLKIVKLVRAAGAWISAFLEVRLPVDVIMIIGPAPDKSAIFGEWQAGLDSIPVEAQVDVHGRHFLQCQGAQRAPFPLLKRIGDAPWSAA